jgi:phosphoglycerate dehydrogenase-like enzyme
VSPARLRLLVSIRRAQNPVFAMTPERFAAACARHPDVAGLIDPVFVTDEDGLDAALRDADAILGWRFARDNLAARAPRLRWIQLTGAGAEHLMPLDWLPRGAAITTASGVHEAKARDFAAMALLMLHTRVPAMATNQQAHRWRQIFTPTIAGRTVLVVGVGAMGRAVVRAARTLGLKVLGIRRSGRPMAGVHAMGTLDDLDRFLPRADLVALTAPATAATTGLLDARRFGLMKPGAGLLNMGRAALVDNAALTAALDSGRLSGAVVDVFDPEPLPAESPLWDVPNLFVVPHCSSDDADIYAAGVLDLTFENAARLLAGRPLRNRLQPRRQY